MPTDIDGFAVLGAIAAQPKAFPFVKAEANKAARALVVKQLKHKTSSLESLHLLTGAINLDNFDLIADGLSDADIKSLLAKLDKENADAKAADARTQRQHLAALARGTVAPLAKPPARPRAGRTPATRTAPATAPTVERAGNSKAMKAKRGSSA